HLSLNYLSLTDGLVIGNQNKEQAATALRDLLRLYTGPLESRAPGGTATGSGTEGAEFSAIRKQVEGVKSISTKQVIRRINKPGPISFARGLEITLTLDEINFEGSGVFLLGAVLARFFEKYVSINSFTETVIRTIERGEVMRWPARLGLRHTL
ncbi:MAG TPA: type VI secretion system baseplate subunit TssF, partial [Phycisphaerae bacterium]